MKRRLTYIILTFMIVMSMAGCAGKNKQPDTQTESAITDASESDAHKEGNDAADDFLNDLDSKYANVPNYVIAYADTLEQELYSMHEDEPGIKSFCLAYIDEDDVPELICMGTCDDGLYADAYSYKNGEVTDCDRSGIKNSFVFYPGKGIIYSEDVTTGRYSLFKKMNEGAEAYRWFEYTAYSGEYSYGEGDSKAEGIINKADFIDEYNNYVKSLGANASYITIDMGAPAEKYNRDSYIDNYNNYIVEPYESPLSDHYVEYVCDSIGDETAKLINKLIDEKKINPDKILMVNADSFEGNDKISAFIFEGAWDDLMGSYSGNMWFVSDNTIEFLSDVWNDFWYINGRIKAGDKKYIHVNTYAATGGITHIYGVEDGKSYEVNISGIGTLGDIDYMENKKGLFDLVLYDHQYDAIYEDDMFLGHTVKPYYFYYDDSDDTFKEYEAKEVSEYELMKECKIDLANEVTDRGYKVLDCIIRENGIATVNYMHREGMALAFDQVNWDCNKNRYVDAWGDGEYSFENSNYGGTYSLSMLEMYK